MVKVKIMRMSQESQDRIMQNSSESHEKIMRMSLKVMRKS